MEFYFFRFAFLCVVFGVAVITCAQVLLNDSPCFVTSGAASPGQSDLSDEHKLIGAVVGGHTGGGGAPV